MVYRRISLELIVFAEEADAVVATLNSAVDQLEETHTIFGGEIEITTVNKSETQRKSALMHTRAAAGSAVAAVKLASDKVANAYKRVV